METGKTIKKPETKTEKAAFAAGCFWGVEEAFRTMPGVKRTTVGYMGGITKNPTYADVCTGKTGHAETVLVEYDPKAVPYGRLLQMFFAIHDPTSLNAQGADYGSQYRSVVFYFTESQKKAAERMKKALGASGKHVRPIVTEIAKAGEFYNAEDYHQKFMMKSGRKVC
jgi:peptide-methionine (S)-S-oxide reductase